MIEWSEKMRSEQPGIFCIEAMKTAKKPLIIVSDIRRKTDITWFKEAFGGRVRTIRIYADDSVRSHRGWKHTQGVDDIQSECDLDDYFLWDLMIDNGDDTQTERSVRELLEFVVKQGVKY